MKKVAYVLTVGTLFVVAGLLYIHERLAWRILRKRMVTYKEGAWDDEGQGS